MQGGQRQFAGGELVIREGDQADCAYIIESGRVRVSRQASAGSVVLAELGPGELVGEMGIISEKPRSATVVALEPSVLKVIERQDFLDTMQSDREMAVKLLRVLFDRLRQADARLSQLEKPQPIQHNLDAQLVALTPEAQAALGKPVQRIHSLPCRIGRRDGDPLSYNDIALIDSQPYQISRHHLMVLEEQGKLAVYDRGSSLGSWVQGQLLGGASMFEGPVLLGQDGLELVLGSEQSPMRFRLEMIRA